MTNFKAHRYELLLPYQLRAIVTETPTAYIPLGTYEWHCEHLPVGLDALTAHGLCLRAASEMGGVVLPPLYYGTGGDHSAYPWTIMMHDAREIETQLMHSLKRLEENGFRHAVILSGHFADTQLEMIDQISETWNQSPRQLRVFVTSMNRIKNLNMGPDHAGIFETTLLHALHPELVQIERLPTLKDKPLARTDNWADGRHDPSHPIWGVIGPDPRGFDPTTSANLLNDALRSFVQSVRDDALLI